MNTRIFRWKPNSGENHCCRRLSLQNFIIKKTSYNMYWCRLKPARKHPPVESYNLLSFTSLTWKGATTPCSRLPNSPGREPLPPDIHTSLYWQNASSFRLKASTFRSTANHVSSIFKLDQTVPTQPFTYQQTTFAQCFKQNSETTITRISKITQTSE